jgi:restriction system protein
MAIPNFQDVMLPILRFTADGGIHPWQRLRDECAIQFQATEDELAERLDSGGSRFDSRVQWAITHMVQAGLLRRPKRGHVEVTRRGLDVLAENPPRVDMPLLAGFAEYQDFRNRTRAVRHEERAVFVKQALTTTSKDTEDIAVFHGENGDTPLEAIAEAVKESHEALATEVLQRVLDQEPAFLERLVLKLLTAMGYGGRAGAAEQWGRSGDGGIDGVVRQDVLGLDRVYVQAKRYSADNPVGRPDIQAFVGALHGVQADRGVFITTSRYSNEARSYVERIPNRIVLIDGRRLSELMILHNVGVQDESTFVLKRIDEDFFDQI